MGKDLAEAFPIAKGVFGEVDAALGADLSRLCFDGPADELTATRNAQPALFAHGAAVWALTKEALFPHVRGAALDFVEQLVGRADPVAGVRLGKVAEPLSTTSDLLIGKWGQKLTHFAFGLLEQPRFRLAGAEEAVRQIIATIEQTLVHYEGLAKELTRRAEEAYKRLGQLLANLQTGQQGSRTGRARQFQH